jgi:putative ABC transport system permease protein
MFRNYFKIAWRNLRRNKLYSIINITGLSIGIACCILIFLFVQHELSYDKYNVNAHRIYRLTEVLHMPKGDNARVVTSPPMAPALKANFPEIEKAVRINLSSRALSKDEKTFFDTRIMYADSDFFNVFTFPAIYGSTQHALTEPYSIVLTESTAKKYFGDEKAVGKTMQLSDTIALNVTAVIQDVPENSHFTFDCILSSATMYKMSPMDMKDVWYFNNFYTYLLLAENHDAKNLESKITSYIGKEMAEQKKQTGLWYDLKLQPLTDIHLKSNLNSEIASNGDITYVYIFSAAAFLILLIACCNFINLSTAKSINRAKEIGLRKVIGAQRTQLTMQFLGESILFAVVSTLLALIIVVIILPFYNSFTSQTFSLSFLLSPSLFLVYAVIILCIGFVAGIYPAFLMSSFKPVSILKGQLKHEWKDIFLRKGLVVFQFTIAIVLIVGTALIFQQLRFIQNQKLGLNKEQVIEFDLARADAPKQEILLKEISKTPGVASASLTDFTFKYGISSVAVIPEGFADNEVSSQPVISIDENFLKTFDIPLAAGRGFSKEFPTDPSQGFMVNETAVKEFGWKDNNLAIGKNINWDGKKGKVVGVVKDFNFNSLHQQIKPLILTIEPAFYGTIAAKINPRHIQDATSSIEQSWKKITGHTSQGYTFLNDDFAKLYKTETTMQSILGVFTVLSVFVACLGLFGLTAFTVKQRFREIGIRKVLGANVISVIRLVSNDLLKLVCLAVLIAAPLAYISVSSWLRDFAYRISINWWTFVLAGAIALLVAFLTIGLQSFKAAISNPVKSLRTE